MEENTKIVYAPVWTALCNIKNVQAFFNNYY